MHSFLSCCFVDMGFYTVWGCVEGPLHPLQIHSADLCSAYKQHLMNVLVLYINDFMCDFLFFHFFKFLFLTNLFSGFEEVPFLLLVLLPCSLFPRRNKDRQTAVCPRESFLSKTGWLFKAHYTTTGMNIFPYYFFLFSNFSGGVLHNTLGFPKL